MAEGKSDSDWVYKSNLIIYTKRLILRDVDESEQSVEGWFRVRGDEPGLKYVPYKAPKDRDEIREMLKTRTRWPRTFNFNVELRYPEDPSKVGTGENVVGAVGGVRTPEFGYQIHSSHWRKGYAEEAMRAVLDVYWDTFPEGMRLVAKEDRDKARLQIVSEHQGSIALAKKLGFEKTGEEVEEDPEGPVTIETYELKRPNRPPPGAEGSPPRAYEKIESIGPNHSDGPP